MTDLGGRRPDLIGFEVAYARRRSRVTVGFRAILVIPQLIVIYLLGIAAAVVAVIGWFSALVVGRLPRWAAEFLAGFVCWSTRVYAYCGLLVDAYPPFDFVAAPAYPVRVSIQPPGQLNRAAVFFRIILAIPAYIVATATVTGLAIISVLIWLMLVVGGRMPETLFQAMASITRFYVRYFGYLLLLTAAYPSGLFAEPLPIGYSGGPGAGTIGAGPPVGYGPPWPTVPVPLRGGAKVMIAVLAVVGLVANVAEFSFEGSGGFAGGISSALAYSQLSVAHTQFASAEKQAQDQLSTCRAKDPTLNCVETAYSAEGSAYSSFASSLAVITFPAADRGDGRALLRAVRLAGEGFQSVTGAPSEPAFNAEVARRDLTGLADSVDQIYGSLSTKLKRSFP